ncbi:MAG: hypothetical protein ACI8ZB_000587 [Desulforhopalus sp.]|jgi:hypothetical protein
MIVFDGHVHIYDCYDLDRFFTAAFNNFSNASAQLQRESSNTYFMLLAEATGVSYFKKLQELTRYPGGTQSTLWRVEETGESCSLSLFHDDFPSMQIIIAAGRQLITKEKLELLALLTDQEFEDGMTLEKGVDIVINAGGIPVCPWGAGKWLGGRGKVLNNYMTEKKDLFYLGDNGGRPSIWPRPSLFKGDSVATRILSGSDPLPLASEESKVGQFGSYIDCDCTKENPVAFLREQLKRPEIVLTGYGRASCPRDFIKNQVALRLR